MHASWVKPLLSLFPIRNALCIIYEATQTSAGFVRKYNDNPATITLLYTLKGNIHYSYHLYIIQQNVVEMLQVPENACLYEHQCNTYRWVKLTLTFTYIFICSFVLFARPCSCQSVCLFNHSSLLLSVRLFVQSFVRWLIHIHACLLSVVRPPSPPSTPLACPPDRPFVRSFVRPFVRSVHRFVIITYQTLTHCRKWTKPQTA